MTQTLSRVGYWLAVANGYIFTEQIPSKDEFGPIVPLGMGKNAVDFTTAFRYAVPDPSYEGAAKIWRNKPPLTVLRVRAPVSLATVNNTEKLFVHYFTKKCDVPEHVPDPNKLLTPRILTFTQP